MLYKVNMKLSITRQYEVEAENEQDAKDKAASLSCHDLHSCDDYEFISVST